MKRFLNCLIAIAFGLSCFWFVTSDANALELASSDSQYVECDLAAKKVKSVKLSKYCTVKALNLSVFPGDETSYAMGPRLFDYEPTAMSEEDIKNESGKYEEFCNIRDDFSLNATLVKAEISNKSKFHLTTGDNNLCYIELDKSAGVGTKATLYTTVKYKKKTYTFVSTITVIDKLPFDSLSLDGKDISDSVRNSVTNYYVSNGKHAISWKLKKGYKLEDAAAFVTYKNAETTSERIDYKSGMKIRLKAKMEGILIHTITRDAKGNETRLMFVLKGR